MGFQSECKFFLQLTNRPVKISSRRKENVQLPAGKEGGTKPFKALLLSARRLLRCKKNT